MLGDVEREARRVGDRPDGRPRDARAERVRRVLDDGEAESDDRVDIRGLTGEVHRHDRLRPLGHAAGTLAASSVRSSSPHIAEDRARARVRDRVRSRRPGQRSRDHLVARPDVSARSASWMRSRARRDCDDVPRPERLGDPLLEERSLGPGPSHPERTVSVTAATSSSPMEGGWNSSRVAADTCIGET